MREPAETRILKFLKDYPDGTLWVAVGYASVWGLAWLHRHTQERRVRLLIGDARFRHFNKGKPSDRVDAVRFLNRTGNYDKVVVRNWYKKHGEKSDAHLKAWLVKDSGGVSRLLAGSANLSKSGLRHNWEVMVEAHGSDLVDAEKQVKNLFVESWDYQDRILEYIESPTFSFHGEQTSDARQTKPMGHEEKLPRPSIVDRQKSTGTKAAPDPARDNAARTAAKPAKSPTAARQTQTAMSATPRPNKPVNAKPRNTPPQTKHNSSPLEAFMGCLGTLLAIVVMGGVLMLAVWGCEKILNKATPPAQPDAPTGPVPTPLASPGTTAAPATTALPATTVSTATTDLAHTVFVSADDILPRNACDESPPTPEPKDRIGCFDYIQTAVWQYGPGFRVIRIEKIDGLTTLPDWVRTEPGIDTLHIESNRDLTHIPDWIGEMPDLKRLVFRLNPKLTSLPDSIGNIASLRRLEITENHALKAIPETITQLPNLIGIVIEYNSSSADIPAHVYDSLCAEKNCTQLNGRNTLVRSFSVSIED